MGVKKLDERPPCYEQQRMAVNKSAIPPGMTEQKQDKKSTKKRRQSLSYNGPRCFAIPGNHGWSWISYSFIIFLITFFESEKEGISFIYKGNMIKSSIDFITKITYNI